MKAKLQHMVDVDQYTRRMSELPERRKYTDEELLEFNQREPYATVDKQNTADLKELLKIYHWFTISEFGPGKRTRTPGCSCSTQITMRFFSGRVLTILEPLAAKDESNQKFLRLFR